MGAVRLVEKDQMKVDRLVKELNRVVNDIISELTGMNPGHGQFVPKIKILVENPDQQQEGQLLALKGQRAG